MLWLLFEPAVSLLCRTIQSLVGHALRGHAVSIIWDSNIEATPLFVGVGVKL